MNTDLEEIKTRLNIVDVLGEYIRLEKAGANFRANCPFHNEKTPSFMVSEEKQIWHCFGCQKGGDIFGFVMEMEGLEFREALKVLAEKAGVKLANFNPKKAEEKNRTLEILELATKWYEYQLWNGPGKTKILAYLRDRGLKDETIKEFRLGYAPRGWDNMIKFLTKRGYKKEEIAKTGLLVKKENNNDYYDRFRERIMFPIADYSGKVLGYSARVAPGGDESQAKYVNTPETEAYHKSRVLYGIDKAKGEIRNNNYALLVEGNMDVIASWQSGIKNTVAVSGTALTIDQIGIIKRYTKNLKMFFDMDSAGETATKKSIKMALAGDMEVKVVQLPQGKDAADLAKEDPKKLLEAVRESLPAMEYIVKKTMSKHDPKDGTGKKKIVDELVEMLLMLENAVEKNHWIKKIASLINIDESALTDTIKKANLKNRTESFQKVGDKEEFFAAKDKLEMLTDELISLALISKEAWEKMALLSQKSSLPKDRLLSTMLEKGPGVGFNFEKLVSALDDQKERERAEKLFFKKKYRLDLNNNLEEISLSDPDKELSGVVREIEREIKKEELAKIAADLKLAEERKDRGAVNFLRTELKRISDMINQLRQ